MHEIPFFSHEMQQKSAEESKKRRKRGEKDMSLLN